MSLNTILATAPLTTSGYHIKANGTTLGNSLIWDNGTNVGIGNTNTSYTLDVSGTGRFTSTLLVSGGATLSGTETTLNFNPQTNLLASYYYLNFGGGCIMYRNAPDIYIGSNSKYGSAGTTIANYTSANGMGMLTMDGGNLNYQANATSVTAGTVYSMPIRFTINGSGNVGIGTTSPSTLLDVNGAAKVSGTFTAGASNGNIRLTGSTDGFLGVGVSDGKLYLSDWATATKGLVINLANGNVGIGTSTPTAITGFTSVCVNNATTGGFFEAQQGGTVLSRYGAQNDISFIDTVANIPFIIKTNSTERMRITSGGDVFVGFSGSAPGQRLRVQGADSGSANYSLVVANSTTASTFLVRNDGAVQVVGSLSKGSGSFRIDHPLESMTETHQLVHSFIEGPRVDLIYRGKLTLVNGKAQANIDEVSTMTEGTFEVLCREVQCFTTNESGWDLVKGKVIGNIIYIESQNPNSTDEISWMVIGERKDKHIMDTEWTDDNGKVIVEPLKPIETSEPITN